jgi:predicted transcriptional regulator
MEDELWNAAERVAADLDRTASWVIRKALEEYIERHRAAKREAKQTERELDTKTATQRDRKR